MGRKIPGKKHRGVKDPEKQRAKRLADLETKINAPPRNVDEQDIPKSLQRLIKLKNAVKNNEIAQKKRKKKRGPNKLIKLGAEQIKRPSKGKPEKVVPVFDQEPGESKHHFWERVNRETQAFIKETEFETKYNVQVKRNPETGLIEGIDKKPKDELEEIEKLKSKHKNINKKRKVEEGNDAPLSKSQKRKQKLLKRKESSKERQHQNDVDDFKTFKDVVKFGDIVHAPPELKAPRNADKSTTKVNVKGLLLNSMLQSRKSEKADKAKPIDRTGKRKDLPIGERRQLEKQQKDIVAAYRLLKARKMGEST